jgi:predicted nucleic acid-binding protein
VTVLIDTAGMYCLIDQDDVFHPKAVAEYLTAPLRLIHNLVLTELIPLARTRGLRRQRVLDYVRDVSRAVEVQLIWIDEALHDEAVELLFRRPDKDYSLCDAVSFVLMRRYALADALTTDKHFEQEGFTRLLK